jgi:RNA polymerase sigma factor (sigma-70 family)
MDDVLGPEKARDLGHEVGDLMVSERSRHSAILRRWSIPPQDAEDLVQKAFMDFIQKRRRIANPRAWLHGALTNECRMYWRTRRRSRTVAVDTALLEVVAEETEMPAQERAVLRRNLKTWISKLDYRCRQLLKLRYKLGLEPREVAEATGYQPSSVDKVTRRCLESLARKAASVLRFQRG